MMHSSPRIIEILVMAGAEIDAPLKEQNRDEQQIDAFDNGWTPLMHCSWHPESALALIALGANVNARDSRQRTPLMLLYDDDAVVEALLNAGADVNAVDINGRTIFDYIGKSCSPKTRRRLMDARG